MRIRLHRIAKGVRRPRRALGAQMLDCFDELSLIAEHRRNVEGQLVAAH